MTNIYGAKPRTAQDEVMDQLGPQQPPILQGGAAGAPAGGAPGGGGPVRFAGAAPQAQSGGQAVSQPFEYHSGGGMPGTTGNANTGVVGAAQDWAGQHFGDSNVGAGVQTGLQQMRAPALGGGQALSAGQSADFKDAFSAKDAGGAAPAAPASQPFDPTQQVGHNDVFNGRNREQYRDAWMGSGVNSVQGAKDWIAQNGGSWVSDNGTIRTPYGETMDLLFNARGSADGRGEARPIWGGGGGGPAAPGGGPTRFDGPLPRINQTMAGGGAPGGGGLPGGGAPGASSPGNVRDSAQQAVLKLLEDSQKPVSLDDPNLAAQMQARTRQGQRAQERARSMLAERAAVNGDLSGGRGDGSFESNLLGLEQARGEDEQDFAADLVGKETGARRQSLMQAIQIAEQSGQFDKAQELQASLAQMDAGLRSRGLDLQKYGIDTNANLEGRRLDQSADQFGRSLGQADSHFNTQMDFSGAQADADNYYRWVMAGLR